MKLLVHLFLLLSGIWLAFIILVVLIKVFVLLIKLAMLLALGSFAMLGLCAHWAKRRSATCK